MSQPPSHPAELKRLSATPGIRAALALVIGQSVAISILVVTLATLLWLVLDSTLPARSTASLVALTLFAWLLVAAGLLLCHARKLLLSRLVAMQAMAHVDQDHSEPARLFALRSPTTAAAALADAAQLPVLVIATTLVHPLGGALLATGIFAAAVSIHVQRRRAATTPLLSDGPSAGPDRRAVEAAGSDAAATGLIARWQERWTCQSLASIERHRQSMAHRDRAEMLTGLLVASLLLSVLLLSLLSVASGKTTIGALGALLLVSSCTVRITANLVRSAKVLAQSGWWGSAATAAPKPMHGTGFAPPALPLPLPKRRLALESLSLQYAGAAKPAIRAIDCAMSAGSVTAVMGPAGSGKTSLLRAMTGAWSGLTGDIRLDGADFRQFDPRKLAERIGYVGQDAPLFAGSVAENISGFDARIPDAQIIAAARAAGVHEAILRLPGGYSQPVGDGGEGLSASWQRGVAIARAIVRDPFLLIIDDPFLRLDPVGAQAIETVIVAARARGAIVVIASNDQRAVDLADMLMVLRLGAVADFGPRSSVWARARSKQSSLGGSYGPRTEAMAVPVSNGEVA